MRRFLICLHDATPAFARETRSMIQELSPLIGRRLTIAVVPDWHGEWPLVAHRSYCRLVQESSEELLLHGYRHRRQQGWGPVTWLSGDADEMNGLDAEETRRCLERGQRVFVDVFGAPARGFLAPAWQRGRVQLAHVHAVGLDHILGFFCLQSRTGRTIPLATATWDCGRWSWLGHIGHAAGRVLQWQDHRVPVLAIHPRDYDRGYWRTILRRTEQLIETGYEPSTLAGLLEAPDEPIDVEVDS